MMVMGVDLLTRAAGNPKGEGMNTPAVAGETCRHVFHSFGRFRVVTFLPSRCGEDKLKWSRCCWMLEQHPPQLLKLSLEHI